MTQDATPVVKVAAADGSVVVGGTQDLPTLSWRDPLVAGLGVYKSENFRRSDIGTNSALATQIGYAVAVWVPPGQTVTGVALGVSTAAAGNKPTGFFVGLANSTKMLAQSGDVSGNSGSPFATAGIVKCAFSGTYLTNATDAPAGIYYVTLLSNGAWAGTNATFARASAQIPVNLTTETAPAFATIGSALTAFPANGSAITLASTNTPQPWWVAVY